MCQLYCLGHQHFRLSTGGRLRHFDDSLPFQCGSAQCVVFPRIATASRLFNDHAFPPAASALPPQVPMCVAVCCIVLQHVAECCRGCCRGGCRVLQCARSFDDHANPPAASHLSICQFANVSPTGIVYDKSSSELTLEIVYQCCLSPRHIERRIAPLFLSRVICYFGHADFPVFDSRMRTRHGPRVVRGSVCQVHELVTVRHVFRGAARQRRVFL